MFQLAADSVAIHRLTVRGRRGMAEHLRDQVGNADWPRSDEWVFIRRLRAGGPARQLPGQLTEQARRCLTQRENPDEVVRFASLAELLAALLADLVRGRIGFCWYWRRWARWFELPVAGAVCAALSEHIALLPTITAHLAQRGELASVWRALGQAESRQLVAELAGHIGLRLPSLPELTAMLVGKAGASPSAANAIPATDFASPRVPWRLLNDWQPVLTDSVPGDSRYLLALLLIASEAEPLRLQREPAACLAALSAYFMLPALPVAPAFGANEALAKADAGSNASRQAQVTRPDSAYPSMREAGRGDASLVREPLDTGRAGADGAVSDRALPRQTMATESPVSRAAVIASRPGAREVFEGFRSWEASAPVSRPWANLAPAFIEFGTAQGGLLYLLNMLSRPELRTLMLAHAERLASGWAWLYRLGQELQLDEDDALVDFIALQLGLENCGELRQLPALPAREQVLDLAHRWYGKTGVWQAELLSLPARIRVTPSHIDLYAAMTAIRLPVRLAGLDIDPGWLPWLGRVVSFHYD